MYRRRGAAQMQQLLGSVVGGGILPSCGIDQRAKESSGRRSQRVPELVAEPQALVRDTLDFIPVTREVAIECNEEERFDLLGDGAPATAVVDHTPEWIASEVHPLEVGARGRDPGDSHRIRGETQAVE